MVLAHRLVARGSRGGAGGAGRRPGGIASGSGDGELLWWGDVVTGQLDWNLEAIESRVNTPPRPPRPPPPTTVIDAIANLDLTSPRLLPSPHGVARANAQHCTRNGKTRRGPFDAARSRFLPRRQPNNERKKNVLVRKERSTLCAFYLQTGNGFRPRTCPLGSITIPRDSTSPIPNLGDGSLSAFSLRFLDIGWCMATYRTVDGGPGSGTRSPWPHRRLDTRESVLAFLARALALTNNPEMPELQEPAGNDTMLAMEWEFSRAVMTFHQPSGCSIPYFSLNARRHADAGLDFPD